MTKGWRTAFILQGHSDFRVFEHLRHQEGIEACHSLHYLQMASEKIAKGLALSNETDEPPRKHNTLMMWIKQAEVSCHSDLMDLCHCKNKGQFKAYLGSLRPIAQQVENLAPDLAGKALTGVNPEYPWKDAGSNEVQCPASYDYFRLKMTYPKVMKFVEFIKASFEFGNLLIRN